MAEMAQERKRKLEELEAGLSAQRLRLDTMEGSLHRATNRIDKVWHTTRFVLEGAEELEAAYRQAESTKTWFTLKDLAPKAILTDVAKKLGFSYPPPSPMEGLPGGPAAAEVGNREAGLGGAAAAGGAGGEGEGGGKDRNSAGSPRPKSSRTVGAGSWRA